MKAFDYLITDELGIHARPAGLLCKLAKSLDSRITVEKGEKSADATSIISLMMLGVKKGDLVHVTAVGGDEETSAKTVEAFFKENL